MGKGKVLLMDDEFIVMLSLGRYLKNLEYEVETAQNGVKTIELFKKAMNERKPFDAVVLDLKIPDGMGGRETIKELLKINPNVKVIITSGCSSDPVMTNFEEYGFKGVVAKPYEISDLEGAIHKVIMGA